MSFRSCPSFCPRGRRNATSCHSTARVPWRRRKLGATGMTGRQDRRQRVGVAHIGFNTKENPRSTGVFLQKTDLPMSPKRRQRICNCRQRLRGMGYDLRFLPCRGSRMQDAKRACSPLRLRMTGTPRGSGTASHRLACSRCDRRLQPGFAAARSA